MGKKSKLNLDDLKITSFVTSINRIKGGLPPTQTCGCGAGNTGTICETTDTSEDTFLATGCCGNATQSCGPCTTGNTTG